MKLPFIFPLLFAVFWVTVKTDNNAKRDANGPALLKTLRNIERLLKFGPCPSGWTHFKSGYCYFVSSAIKTWHKAQAYCKRLGGELVKINSNEENEFVLKLVHEHEPSLKQVWIGLKWVTSQFIWSDDSVPNYTKWAPGEPNGKASEPCSNMWIKHPTAPGINGYWNDLSCWHPAYPCGIVCKRLP